MIKKEEMRVDMLVWWTAERYTKAWDCPCIVTHVEEKGFRIISFDDFKETKDLLRMDDIPGLDKSSRSEMRICSLDEVKQYLKKNEHELKAAVTEAKDELADAKKELKTYQQKVEEFLAKQEKQ